MIQYCIQPIDPHAHIFAITIQVNDVARGQRFSLPAWLPGSYMIRDFSRNLLEIRAKDQLGAEMPLTQIDKQTWQLEQGADSVILSYHIYAWDLSVRGAHLDQTHGFFNGSSVFLSVNGQEERPIFVELLPPEGDQYDTWQVATTLPLAGAEPYGFGLYQAENYDELIDHPVEMGAFTLATFEANGIQHDLVLTGRHFADLKRICQDLKKICEYQLNLFGDPAPFERYLFLTQVIGNGFGGLEHRSSTALICSRADLPSLQETSMTEGYRTFLSLCSHEYFHNWNVKRIKPASFIPFKLDQESYTCQLWAYEGITSYYDDLIVYKAGCVDRQTYLTMLAQGMTRVMRGQGRFKQTLRESSFNAWTKFYKQDENAQNAIVNYYTKGAMFALWLDLTLRHETQGQKCLDDAMRRLWQNFGQTGLGTHKDTHQTVVSELLQRDVSDLFQYLDNTQDLPLTDLLAQFGVKLILRQSTGNQDKGGTEGQALPHQLGAQYKPDKVGVKIITVRQGGAAHRAGLAANDILIAVDQLQVDSDLDSTLQRYQIGDKMPIHFFRRDELITSELELISSPKDTVVLVEIDSDQANAWLK